MKRIQIISVLFYFVINCFSSSFFVQLSNAAMYFPKDAKTRYLNPYLLMKSGPNIPTRKAKGLWNVLSNKKDAPIYTNNGQAFKKSNKTAAYLRVLTVEGISGEYVRVKPYKMLRGEKWSKDSWMHMADLILLTSSIGDPGTRVKLKVFLRVRVGEEGEENLERLRFRNGPGPGSGSPYDYTFHADETPRVGTLFLYLYGVSFTDKATENYFEIDNFYDAKYFLVGPRLGIQYHKDKIDQNGCLSKEYIYGWVPRSGAVLWDTRQALEVDQKRSLPFSAHLFDNEDDLKIYFRLSKNIEEQKKYLKDNSNYIVIDRGRKPPKKGAQLRNLVLQEPLYFEKVQYAEVGYSGSDDVKGAPVIRELVEGGYSLQEIQEGSKFMEIFFLIDATKSMGPCINSAAFVAESIMNRLASAGWDDKRITFRAAVYRDVVDGHRGRFEPCPYQSHYKVAKWLNEIEAKTKTSKSLGQRDKYYEESLYFGIDQALLFWNRNSFKHPLSNRIMVIIGDTGDDGSGPDQKNIIDKLTDNLVLPLAIPFVHHPQSATNSRAKQETKAMEKFATDMQGIYNSMYLNSRLNTIKPVVIQSRTLDQASAEIMKSALQKAISTMARSITNDIEEFVKIRFGMNSYKTSFCNRAYPIDSRENAVCRNCQDLNCIADVLISHLPKAAKKNHTLLEELGFSLARMRLLLKQCPECIDFVNKKPEMGFAEGYIAVKQGEQPITRPVLLLSHKELKDISERITYLLNSDCDLEDNMEYIIRSLATILGEVLQVSPENIPESVLKRWFAIPVDAERTYLIEDLAYSLCENSELFTKWIKSLQEVPVNIAAIFRNRSERSYIDVNNVPYFWVYPEEIFPAIN